MANNESVDNLKRFERLEKYLVERRSMFIKQLLEEGYTQAQIARLFRMDESNLSQELKDDFIVTFFGDQVPHIYTQCSIKCPICNFEYNHVYNVETEISEKGRNEINVYIPFECENFHRYKLLFRFHEGYITPTWEYIGEANP